MTLPNAAPVVQAELGLNIDVQSADGGPKLATLGQRFMGALIDFLIGIPWGIAVLLAVWSLGMDPRSPELRTTLTVASGVVLSPFFFLILHGYLLAHRGQTIGKYFMGTQITGKDGRLVPLIPLFCKRYLLFMVIGALPRIGLVVGLANVLAIFRVSRKCLHDEVAGTRVVQLLPR